MRSSGRESCAAALAAALVTLAAALPARAASTPVRRFVFAWTRGEGAETCPGQPEIAREVRARLGRDPFSDEAERSIEAVVTREGGRWFIRIRVREGQQTVGFRELTSDAADCGDIKAASVLAVALVVDPEAALNPESLAPPPPAPPLPSSPAQPRAPAPPPLLRGPQPSSAKFPPKPSPPATTKVALTYRGIVGFGLMPRAAPALALSVGVGRDVFEGSTGLLWVPEVTSTEGDFAFGTTGVWVGACLHLLRFTRGSVATCGGVLGGAIHSVVRSLEVFEPLEPGDRGWAAVSLSGRLRVSLVPPLVAEVGVEALGLVTRYRFSVKDQPEPIFEQPPIALAPFLGLGVSIP